MLKDKLKVVGKLTIARNGEVILEVPNLVVTSGKGLIAANLQGTNVTPVTHMAIGTGTTEPAVSDTALVAEVHRNGLGTSGGTVSGTVVTYTSTFSPGEGTGAITEAGLFTASSGGTMLCRTTFLVLNKGVADTYTIVWTVTQE